MKSGDVPGLAMSRSFGDTVASKVGVISIPDIFEIQLKPSHKILILASDGIWSVLSNERVVEIAGMFYKSGNVKMACARLVEEARNIWINQGGNIDDITATIVYLK